MFTGIIEEIGEISGTRQIPGGIEIQITAPKMIPKVQIGDSVSIDGACQTVTQLDGSSFTVQAVGDTLQKTTLGTFSQGRKVNLESALTLQKPLGGHLLQGHVNGVASLLRWEKKGDNYHMELTLPPELIKYCIEEGSIAVDGISLTISGLTGSTISISVIPHTVRHTTLSFKRRGDKVNIETDVIGRYLERFLSRGQGDHLTIEKIKNWGY